MFTPDTAALGRIAVQDVDGRPVVFGSAWADRPAVFVFLRHFG
jgi:hypothetical protein